MEKKEDKIETYELVMIKNVRIEPIPLGSIDKLCGIYCEKDNQFCIFINDKLLKENHERYDDTIEILMGHHDSDRGVMKHVTAVDVRRFNRVMAKVKRYERKAINAFLKSIPFSAKLLNE